MAATGTGTLHYQWYYKESGKTSFSKSSITGEKYAVKMDAAKDGRQVYCVITDNYGQSAQTEPVTLQMVPDLEIVQQPSNYRMVRNTGYAAWTVETTGAESCTFEWWYSLPGETQFQKDESHGRVRGPNISQYVGINSTDENDGYRVYCVITDNYGRKIQSDIGSLTIRK